MAKITIKELESLTANDAGRILREDGNLAGRISVRKDGVSVSFFYRYRWGDQYKEYACGSWPRKSLTDIRKARNQARALIDEQINPNEHKKTAKAQAYVAANVEAEQVKTAKVKTLTVQDLAKAWLLDGVARKDGNAELQRRFTKDLFPALGKTAVSSVSEHDVNDRRLQRPPRRAKVRGYSSIKEGDSTRALDQLGHAVPDWRIAADRMEKCRSGPAELVPPQ